MQFVRSGSIPRRHGLGQLPRVRRGALQLEHGVVVEQQLRAVRGGQLPGVDGGRELRELPVGELLRGALSNGGRGVCSWALRPVDRFDQLRKLPPGQVLLYKRGDRL